MHSTFKKGTIAQLVQSICLTSRGSAVRTRVLPQEEVISLKADGLFYIMAYTYILYSPSLDSYYVGHTELDPAARLTAHFKDHKGFTGKVKDWKIVFEKAFDSKVEAYAFERQIKGWKSRRAIQNLIRGV